MHLKTDITQDIQNRKTDILDDVMQIIRGEVCKKQNLISKA